MDTYRRSNRKGRREYARQIVGERLPDGELAKRRRENTAYNNRHGRGVRKVWDGR